MKQFLRAIIILFLVSATVVLFWPMAMPLFFGMIFFPVLYPTFKRLTDKFPKLNRSLAAIIVINLFLAIVLVPSVLIGIHGARITIEYLKDAQVSNTPEESLVNNQEKNIQKVDSILQNVNDKLGINIPPLEKTLRNNLKRVSTFLLGMLNDFLVAIPDFILAYVIVLLTLFFSLVETAALKAFFIKNTLLSPERSQKLLSSIFMCSRSVIISNVVTGATQATIVGLGALITKSGDFFVVSFITFILSFIPVVGAAPVAFGLGIYQLSIGNIGAGITMCVVGSFVGVVDNIIRPYLIRGTVDIHPFLSLIAILGGILLFGLPGLFIGPLVFSIVYEVLPLYIEEYKANDTERKNP